MLFVKEARERELLLPLAIPPVIRTIRSKDELTPEVRRIHRFFIGMVKRVRSGG